MTQTRLRRGRAGEEATREVYRRRGYAVLATNWRSQLGEIDLILRRGDTLVFCEVKTRSGSAYGGGYEAVTWTKRRKLRQLGESFLDATGVRPVNVRFDVASVTLRTGPGAGTDVEIFQDAF
jgi:putative endonuclease